MVRERVGDWRSAWRSALAGLVAGLLVIAVVQTGLLDAPFFAAQDRLFPAPPPDNGITLVAIDSASKPRLAAFPWTNEYHARVINYLASLHPKVILFDVIIDHSIADAENPTADEDLARAIKNAGNVVLVCTASAGPIDQIQVGEPIGDLGFGTPDPANAIRSMSIQVKNSCLQNESRESAFVQALRIAEKIPDPIDISG